MEKEGGNDAEGETPNQIKTKLDARGSTEAPERLQLAVAFMWLMWLPTEDQRATGQISRSLRKSADKSRGRKKRVEVNSARLEHACPLDDTASFVFCYLLSEYFKPFFYNIAEMLQHKS